MNEQMITTSKPMTLSTWDDMERMAKNVAASGMFGVSNPAQAMCLFAIAISEGTNPLAVLKKYHIVEGRPSMRADAMLAEFLKSGGGVIYHVRTDKIVAATYYADRSKIDDEARKNALERVEIILQLERGKDMEPEKRKELYIALTRLNRDGEQTIVRTISDAIEKGIAIGKDGQLKSNWKRYPRQMLAARCDTEGIRIVAPHIVCGVMEMTEAAEVVENERAERPAQSLQEEIRLLEDRVIATRDKEERRRLAAELSDLREKAQEAEEADDIPMDHSADENYVLRFATGMLKGMSVADVPEALLSVYCDNLKKRVQKEPHLKPELDQVQAELDRRAPANPS